MLWHHDAKGVKKVLCGQLDGKGWEQLIDETPEHRCIHDKEIVCGRWGCQDHYAALRKTELAEVDKESRPKALRESLLINKRAWEKLPLGASELSTCCATMTKHAYLRPRMGS